MSKYVLLLLLISLLMPLFESIYAQTAKLPVLSEKQMFADFDKFTDTVKEISPQNPVRKKVTGIDAFKQLKKMRTRIPKIKSSEEFAHLMRDAITVLQDGHSSLLWKGYLAAKDGRLRGISEQAIQLQNDYDELLRIAPAQRNKFNLRLTYINGEYYNIATFVHQNQRFAMGFKLIKIKGQNVHLFISKLLPYKRMMRWDFKHRRYYAEDFYKANYLLEKGELKLAFADQNGKKYEGIFKLTEPLTFETPPKTITNTTKKVEYFPERQILYVRIPKMNQEDTEFYQQEIKKHGAGKTIQKVVIDVRDNGGGSDNVWVDALSAIIDRPITYKNFILCNPSATLKKEFPEDSPKWETYTARYLDNYKYAVFASNEAQIEPAADSLGYDGNIYILQNENIYSSTGSLAAVGVLTDRIFTVGSPTGRLLGRGINPLVYELPNSKILYRIEPVIDFLNVKTAADVYHDRVEIPVNLTLDEYLERINYEGDVYGQDFLFNRDPLFKKVLEIK